MHAIESRLSEEENNRIQETQMVQDNIGKLIFSIQQNSQQKSLGGKPGNIKIEEGGKDGPEEMSNSFSTL